MADAMITHSYRIGDARLDIFNAGDIYAPLRSWLQLPPNTLPELPAHVCMPVQCVLIQLGAATVLVDGPSDHGASGTSYAAPGGRQPMPTIVTQLAAAGCAPESVTHVVITHAHEDHLSGLVGIDGRVTFASAWHYIQRADDDWAKQRYADTGQGGATVRVLEALHNANLLMRIGRDQMIAPGILAMPTPGESPGHQAVRVESKGQSAYCIGDLYHHESEIAHGFNVLWADPEQNRLSRTGLAVAALLEDPLLIAAHIPGAGKLASNKDGLRWIAQA
jgi:glyoxylase-like metal-dependent hydrolase (beta-lactamase superfamily II)